MSLLTLSLSERRALAKQIHTTKDAKILKRAQAFLWLSDGMSVYEISARFIGKYLSGLRKLDHVIILKEGFETQLRTPCLSIPCGMCALGMTRQIRDGLLQRGIEPRHVPALQGPDNVA